MWSLYPQRQLGVVVDLRSNHLKSCPLWAHRVVLGLCLEPQEHLADPVVLTRGLDPRASSHCSVVQERRLEDRRLEDRLLLDRWLLAEG